MNVLIDTSIWSQALRKKDKNPKNNSILLTLAELISESRAQMIGPIRQELLSGISHQLQYRRLQKAISPFEDLPIVQSDYERAAEMFNICKKKGVQGSHTDFLICSVAERYHMSIFTLDNDFSHYSKYLPLVLYESRK